MQIAIRIRRYSPDMEPCHHENSNINQMRASTRNENKYSERVARNVITHWLVEIGQNVEGV